jgi:uncharacterized membrane protein
MAPRYILAVVGFVFLIAGIRSAARVGTSHPRSRTWLLVGAIMAAMSAWLFVSG